eukprot:Hpha_TRINITY_DN15002_c1_g1::TRINITY_DN15002_c1_g1_i2::g.125202::m.125202
MGKKKETKEGKEGPVPVVLVCGLPGSGKSTLSKSLERCGWERVSQDELGSQDECKKALQKAIRHYRPVIIDRCNVTPGDRKLWLQHAKKEAEKGRSVRFEVVFMDVPNEVCARRAEQRQAHETLSPELAEQVIGEFCRGMKVPEKWEGPYDAVWKVTTDGDLRRVQERYTDPKNLRAIELVHDGQVFTAPPPAAARGTPPRGRTTPPRRADPQAGVRRALGCELFILRHGERKDKARPEAHAADGFPDDALLTATGRGQSRTAAGVIAERIQQCPRVFVYASPFSRCIQTAAEVAQVLSVPVRVEPGLAELMNSRIFKTAAPEIRRPGWAEQELGWCGGMDTSVPPILGNMPPWPETGEESKGRVVRTARALVERHQGDAVVLVCHAHSLIEISKALPIDGTPVGGVPQYCALTHITKCGRCPMAARPTKDAESEVPSRRPAEPGEPVGRWDGRKWCWIPRDGAPAAAAEEEPPRAAALEADTPPRTPPRSPGRSERSGRSTPPVDAESAAEAERIMEVPLSAATRRFPDFAAFLAKQTESRRANFERCWGASDPKVVQLLGGLVRKGMFENEGEPGVVRTLSLNIWNDPHEAERRLEAAAALIADSDVACLQECTVESLRVLMYDNGLAATHISSADRGAPAAPFFPVTLVRRRFEPSFVSTALPGGQKRSAVLSTIEAARGRKAVVANVHLESFASNGGTREAQLDRLFATLAAQRTQEGGEECVVVVAGDFNFCAENLAQGDAGGARAVERSGFRDLWREARGKEAGSTVDSVRNKMLGALVSGAQRKSRLDRVLIQDAPSAAVSIDSCAMVGTAPLAEGVWVSDHFGLRIDLRVPQGPAGSAIDIKFPRTSHLLSAGGGDVQRDDLLMDPSEAERLLGAKVTVEEKIDGSNLGISFDQDTYQVVFQNRGKVIGPDTAPQWGPLQGWIDEHNAELFNILGTTKVLLGEWCVARHSVRCGSGPYHVRTPETGRRLWFPPGNTPSPSVFKK